MFWKKKNDLRCAVCTAEYDSKLFRHPLDACPNCGTKIPPLKTNQDVAVKLNWQDLRVLAIYAKRWSHLIPVENPINKQALEALRLILKNLEKYQPKGSESLIIKNEVVRLEIPLQAEQKVVPTGGQMVFEKDVKGRIISPFFKRFKL